MLGNGFTRKKVESLTLGEKLRKFRAEYHVTLPDVAKYTGIRKEYLEYLEAGAYEKLPADVYLRGFLRSYAHCLGVDPKSLVRLYERERSIAKNLGKEPENTVSAPRRRRISFASFVVTPTIMIGVLATLLVLGISGYLYREFRLFVSEPFLIVTEPANGQEVRGDETVVVGKTDRDAKLSLNGQPIFVNEAGEFRERLRLQRGMNSAEIKVVNRFGKERVETLSIQAAYDVPEEAATLDAPPVKRENWVYLSTSEPSAVSIVVTVAGKEAYRGELMPGETKEFECVGGCVVDSTSAAGTLASWSGAEAKPLGGKPGPAKGILFPPKNEVKQGEEEKSEKRLAE